MSLVNVLLAVIGLLTVASLYFKSDAIQACLLLVIFLMVVIERRSRRHETQQLWRQVNGNQRTK